MTTRKIDSDSLKGKRVLLAWHPEEDGPELEQLRDQLERAGAAVEIAKKISDIKHHIDVARTTGEVDGGVDRPPSLAVAVARPRPRRGGRHRGGGALRAAGQA